MVHRLLSSPALVRKKGIKRAAPSVPDLVHLVERFACNDFSIWDELLSTMSCHLLPPSWVCFDSKPHLFKKFGLLLSRHCFDSRPHPLLRPPQLQRRCHTGNL